MPFWTLFWLIVPAVVLLAIGTWLHVRGEQRSPAAPAGAAPSPRPDSPTSPSAPPHESQGTDPTEGTHR